MSQSWASSNHMTILSIYFILYFFSQNGAIWIVYRFCAKKVYFLYFFGVVALDLNMNKLYIFKKK